MGEEGSRVSPKSEPVHCRPVFEIRKACLTTLQEQKGS